ncbi:membrane integrity-associated transporter subunit PqiC [Pseudomonas sp. TH41]|uniref:PqiC family protein n=1 Tax=Pseudomonas sp. TH41 TaxID=2796405 RepID=UPI00191446B3|nr:PqiC family protein [Pseudomonas sp. TH41]MBK5352326.1 membrane integrity-associated transporter subunit PqiC [Pseudomonas sp. TH41]
MAFPLKITLITTLLLLTACRSDPIQFHTLTPTQLGAGASVHGADIQIEGLSVPPQVDRPQIVIRQGNSGVAILETEWWAATLVDELRSALVDQLVNSNPQRKMSLRLDVQRFDSIPGQYALLDVKWRLRKTGEGDNSLITCRTTLRSPSGPSIDELVVAHQYNVKRLAALISQVAGRTSSECPAGQ